jgi:hypothetical protein
MPNSTVLPAKSLQYESMDKAQAVCESTAWEDAITVGRKCATFGIYGVEGVTIGRRKLD